MAELRACRAGDRIGPHWRHGRRYLTYSRALGGGLVVNVVDGVAVGVGLEPSTEVLVQTDGHVVHLERRRPVLVWAAPIAGAAAAAAGAVATGVVLRHRRAA